jgi:hypothetical protein
MSLSISHLLLNVKRIVLFIAFVISEDFRRMNLSAFSSSQNIVTCKHIAKEQQVTI